MTINSANTLESQNVILAKMSSVCKSRNKVGAKLIKSVLHCIIQYKYDLDRIPTLGRQLTSIVNKYDAKVKH